MSASKLGDGRPFDDIYSSTLKVCIWIKDASSAILLTDAIFLICGNIISKIERERYLEVHRGKVVIMARIYDMQDRWKIVYSSYQFEHSEAPEGSPS